MVVIWWNVKKVQGGYSPPLNFCKPLLQATIFAYSHIEVTRSPILSFVQQINDSPVFTFFLTLFWLPPTPEKNILTMFSSCAVLWCWTGNLQCFYSATRFCWKWDSELSLQAGEQANEQKKTKNWGELQSWWSFSVGHYERHLSHYITFHCHLIRKKHKHMVRSSCIICRAALWEWKEDFLLRQVKI